MWLQRAGACGMFLSRVCVGACDAWGIDCGARCCRVTGATLAFKARWGQLYTNKLAFRYGRAKDHLCLACRTEPDSIGHLLGGCQEATCKAMTIQRHNEGMRQCGSVTRPYPDQVNLEDATVSWMYACPSGNKPQGVDSTRPPAWLLT